MATKTWIGNAAAVKQITTITVSGTWLAADTPTFTINGKDLVVTVVTGTVVGDIAIAMKEAFMASSRLDGTATTDSTSNMGGQEHGEFSEITASVSAAVITLVGNTPGKPFTLTATDNSTSGVFTLATPQAATGPNHWDNIDNWDTGAVPVDDDVVVFRDSSVACKYGLPNDSLEVTINTYNTYTGQVGLHRTNADNASKPYYEYRQRYVRLDDAGAGTDIAHRFGIGEAGSGFTLFNLRHSTLKCSPVIYHTGSPQVTGTHALNICCTAATATIAIINGSVDYGSQDGATAAFASVKQTNGNTRSINGVGATAGIWVYGGIALIGGTGAFSQIIVKGGAVKLEGQSGAIASLYVIGGTLDYSSTATVTTLSVYGGTFDASFDAGGFTITTGYVYGGRFLDPGKRMTIGTAFWLEFNPSPDLIFGTSIADPMSITP